MPKLSVKIFDFTIAILLGIVLLIPSIIIAILRELAIRKKSLKFINSGQ